MKISIIGAGSVGGQLAFCLALKNYSEIILVDIDDSLAEGKALDIMESAPIWGFKGKVKGTGDYASVADSDIVVITAGKARTPGMTREDLLHINSSIAGKICGEVKKYAPEAIVINVTNPLDVITYAVFKNSGFPASRVLGMAGVLDTARYRYFISEETGVFPLETEALVLGPHGNSMVVTDRASVSGRSLSEVLDGDKILELKERARNGGKEVVELLKTGSAYFAPSASVMKMIEAIAKDTKEILPCCVFSEGKYGLEEVFIGLPAKLGKSGVEEIIEAEISADELKQLRQTAAELKRTINGLNLQ